MKHNFEKPQISNPLKNVLLPEIQDNPTRKSAPPAFNPKIEITPDQEISKTEEKINLLNKQTNVDREDKLERISSSLETWALSISVSVNPGQTQHVWISIPTKSWQVDLVNPSTACLLVT